MNLQAARFAERRSFLGIRLNDFSSATADARSIMGEDQLRAFNTRNRTEP